MDTNNKTTFSPMINVIPGSQSVDGNRLQMGKAHHTQYLPLKGSKETPLLRTNYLNAIATNSKFFLKKALHNGYVKRYGNKLVVTYQSSTNVALDIDEVDIMSIYPYFEVPIEDGPVQKGQVLMKNQSISDKGLVHGVHLNTVAEMLSYTFEDSIVLTESGASKLTSLHYDVVDYELSNIFDLNIEQFNEGYLHKGDWIIKEFRKTMQVLSAPTKTIRCEDTGTIFSIEIQMFDDYIASTDVRDFIDEHSVTNELETILQDHPKHAKKLKTAYSSLFSEPQDGIGILRITYAREEKVQVGDKVVNRYGNKGIVSKIIPDDEGIELLKDKYEIFDFVPDLFYNPFGIHTRMNAMQLGESALVYVCKNTIPKIVRKLIKEKDNPKDILLYIIEKVHFKIDPELAESVIIAINKISESKQLVIIKDILNSGLIVEVDSVVPGFMLKIADIVQELDPEYWNNLKRCGYGVNYIMKLHHQVGHKIKGTSTDVYSMKYHTPLNGQKKGEMELWDEIAYDAPASLFSDQKTKSDEHSSKAKTFEQIVKYGTTSILDTVDKESTSLKLIKSLMMVVNVDLDKSDTVNQEDLLNEIINED